MAVLSFFKLLTKCSRTFDTSYSRPVFRFDGGAANNCFPDEATNANNGHCAPFRPGAPVYYAIARCGDYLKLAWHLWYKSWKRTFAKFLLVETTTAFTYTYKESIKTLCLNSVTHSRQFRHTSRSFVSRSSLVRPPARLRPLRRGPGPRRRLGARDGELRAARAELEPGLRHLLPARGLLHQADHRPGEQ